MARSVLILDSDLDQLGELAAHLRSRGFQAFVAEETGRALELVSKQRPDALLIAEGVAGDYDFACALVAETQARAMACFILVEESEAEGRTLPEPWAQGGAAPPSFRRSGELSSASEEQVARSALGVVSVGEAGELPMEDELFQTEPSPPAEGELRFEYIPRGDMNLLVQRLLALPKKSSVPARSAAQDFRGDLQQVSAADVLQLLGMNRRTGLLSVSTLQGEGEVRLDQGEIVDAVYLRMSGEKALYRLLAERQGYFQFIGGEGVALRRVFTPTRSLLMEGMRRVDEVRALKAQLPDDMGFALARPPGEEATELERRLVDYLHLPRSLDEMLDELPYGDLEVLSLLNRWLAEGLIEPVAYASRHVHLAEAEQLAELAALAGRLRVLGFDVARIILAGRPDQLLSLAHATRRIAEVSSPAEPIPGAPVPYRLVQLRLGEAMEVELVALPIVESFASTWLLALPGAALVVDLAEQPNQRVLEACRLMEVPHAPLGRFAAGFDESDPAQVAAMICHVVEQAASPEN